MNSATQLRFFPRPGLMPNAGEARSEAGQCSLTGCTNTPVIRDGFGYLWCAKCDAVGQIQNQPVQGRSAS